MLANHQEYKIAGHSVLFPCKPYPSQFSMMDKIIKGIERTQNCLLESPTGSGKSLALLCSALAWQTEEKRKQFEEKQTVCEGKSAACACSCHSQKPDGPPRPPAASAACTVTTTAATTSASSPVPASSCAAAPSECGEGRPRSATASADGAPCVVIDDDSDEDFRPLRKFREPGQSHMTTRKKKGRLSIEYEDSPPPSPGPGPGPGPFTAASSSAPGVQQSEPQQAPAASKKDPTTPSVSPCSQCACQMGTQKGTRRKVPKIFYGTRTHKQVAQIVRELGKTAYHEVAMTILASREHTCIHPQVANSGNKNEGCENLVKDAGCRFKDRVIKFQSQSAIKSMGLHSAWDLEDLVELMKKKKACPYFLSRGIKDQSDLIICPYNYLVDPLIRDSMEINLKGQIVILDEAHNIEDCVREAASQNITQEQIQRALHDMDVLMEKGVKVADISKLRQMCHKLDMFIEEQSSQLTQHDFEQSYRMWSGFEIVAQLQRLDLGPQDCDRLTTTVASIKAAEAEERLHSTGQEQQSLSTATWTLLDQIFLVLKYMYKDNMKYAEDYRASIVKSIQYVSANLNGSWLNSRRKFGGRKTPVEVFTLNFWCMNPAVGFADFECCRSVILTSGTLSPMDSFQSELGMPFPIVLEANHIIKDSQVWVGAVGQGPNGKSLQAVYRNMESYEFQDSLGELILGVCKRVPKGVLCFLPSYKTLEKLANRWKMTGLWSRMEEHKHVLCEPRGSDKMDFEQIIQGFYSIINSSEEHEGGAGGIDGALFFAVCRGKVSEGMDFADNFARAVITVGIPYPNFKDIQVELKRKYNDRYQSSRGLLSGHLWYEIQAFRALNQALGRCIRHRKDWGALIIVDDRFIKNTNKYANGLSKWVRQKLRVHRDCPSMMESLSTFTKARLEADQQDSSSQLPSTPLTPASQTMASVLSPAIPLPNIDALLPDISNPLLDTRAPLHDVSNIAKSAAAVTPHAIPATVTKSEVDQAVASLSSESGGVVATETSEAGSIGKSGVRSMKEMLTSGQSRTLAADSRAPLKVSAEESVLRTPAVSALAGNAKSTGHGMVQSLLVGPRPGAQRDGRLIKTIAKTSTTVLVAEPMTKTYTVASNAAAVQQAMPVTASLLAVAETTERQRLILPKTSAVAMVTQLSAVTGTVHLNTGALLPVRRVSLSCPEGTEKKQRILEPLRSGQGHPNPLLVQVPVQVLPPGNHLLQGQSPATSPLSQISVLMAPPGGSAVGASEGVITVVGRPANTAGATRLTSLLPRQPLHVTASVQSQSCPTTVGTLAVPADCTAQSHRSAAPDSSGRSSACMSVVNARGHPWSQTHVANAGVHPSPHTPAATVRGILTSQAAAGGVTSATSSGSADILSVPTNTPMMYLPVSDPSLKPTMLLLPTAMPSQTVMKLPPHLQAALGMEMLVVPAGIRHVVVAGTLEQASALFRGHELQPEPGVAPPQHTVHKSLLVGQAAPGAQSGGHAQSMTGASPGAAAAQRQQCGPSSMGGGGVKLENAVIVTVPLPTVAGVSGLQLKTAAPGSATQMSNQKPGKCIPASAALAQPKGGSVGSLPAVLRSLAPTPTSHSVSVHEASTSGKNSSQASECTTSPSLFGDTQKSQSSSSEEQVGKTPPPPAKPKPTRSAARIPVPWQMTTRSSAASPQAAPVGNTQSLSVVTPSPRASTQAGSKTHVGSEASAGPGPREQGKENPKEDVTVLLRKQLFRNTPRKGGTSSDCLPASDQPSGAERERSKTPAPIEPDRSTESLGSALVREAAPAADSDTDTAGSGAEAELKLQRRVRGSKRRSLSLGRGSKKRRQDEDVLGSVGQAATSSVKCTACGYVLLEEVKDSDFERRENMPTCLKGMADPSKPEVLYFKGSAVTERLSASAAGKCRRQQSSGGLEAIVQLIHCPGCAGGATSSTHNTLLGAKVTVTDPSATAFTGQMWLFTHMVTMTSTSM